MERLQVGLAGISPLPANAQTRLLKILTISHSRKPNCSEEPTLNPGYRQGRPLPDSPLNRYF